MVVPRKFDKRGRIVASADRIVLSICFFELCEGYYDKYLIVI